MTLPFISYGGSSLVAMAFAMGLVLAMSRRRPEAVLPAGRLQRRREPGRRSPWSSCQRRDRQLVVLAAGGTGGHLFPAQALAEVLASRGYVVHLMTDKRGMEYGGRFPAASCTIFRSATISLSKPWLLPLSAFRLTRGFSRARAILRVLARGSWWDLAAIRRSRR